MNENVLTRMKMCSHLITPPPWSENFLFWSDNVSQRIWTPIVAIRDNSKENERKKDKLLLKIYEYEQITWNSIFGT